MSIKQQLAREVAALPESVTLGEAFERLYRAFQAKRERTQATKERPPQQEGAAEQGPNSLLIEERLGRLAEVTGKLVGPVLPDDVLRRENLYEERV